jgi:nucleotide sugar dehydrogenase
MTSMLDASLDDQPGAHKALEVATQRRPSEPMRQQTVAVVGLGYVGLPTALSLTEAGMSVIGYDVSEARLTAIKAQQVDLLPADHVRLDRWLHSEQLALTTDASALAGADTVLVCVPTPVDAHLVPDLSALVTACNSVVAHAVAGQTIVLTSTTYVGCTRSLLVEPLIKRGLAAGRNVFVAFSPERIDPGEATQVPERTPRVVGGVTDECTRRALELLSRTSSVVHATSGPEAAELTKLLENTFRAVNIALANEFSDVARQFDIDPLEVIHAAATKPFGFMPFYPGPGVGGHCIPCDPHYLLWQLKAERVTSPVTEAAMTSIAARPRNVVARAEQILAGSGRALLGSRVLVVGVTYKPGVADVRTSPAIEIINELQRAAGVVAYTDPLVDHIHTAAGELISEPQPLSEDWDLVIAHTIHPGIDYNWLDSVPQLLDTTYRLDHVTHRHLL